MGAQKVTVDQAAECLSLLEGASGAMTAASIAERLGLSGCRETQRRHVRAIIEHLRDGACKIVAAADGYWLTEDEKAWRDYQSSRQIDAKRILGVTGKRKKESDRASSGQKQLFRIGGGRGGYGSN